MNETGSSPVKNSERTLERLVGAAILINDFAEKPLKGLNQLRFRGQNADRRITAGFFSGIDTSDEPSRGRIQGFVRVILDSLLVFRLMKRLGDSADGAEGSGPSVFHRESEAWASIQAVRELTKNDDRDARWSD